MKKVLSLLFVSLLVFSTICFSGCGAINKTEVSILWSGDSEVKVPNSLINSMERAMYIENIDYTHYGAGMEGQFINVNMPVSERHNEKICHIKSERDCYENL